MFASTLANCGAIAAIIGASVVVALALIAFSRWVRRKFLMRNPLELHYLIPQNKYPEASFTGAPDEESKPDCLTVGIGKYRLMHVVTPKTDILTDAIILRFEGPGKDKPKRSGPDNPFIIKPIEGAIGTFYLDWWGDVQPSPEGWPRYLHSGDTLVIGNRIETLGPWEGIAYFEIPLRGSPVIIKRLPFEVVEDKSADQIPFLKGWSDDKKVKATEIAKTEKGAIDVYSNLEGIKERPGEEVPPLRDGASGPL